MDNQLQSISKVFNERLLRIPDYQRGYAWGLKQLKDFWGDIIQLEEDKNHYVGVLTFETVPKNDFSTWEDDQWIILNKSFEPFYIVDGQQRLTTTLILIQAIIETVGDKNELNFSTVEDIKKRYIFDAKPDGISGSYMFGYHKDNPSYEFLKTKIFNEFSGSAYLKEETIYTHNLEFSKNFFIEKLAKLNHEEIGIIFKKVTQNFLFNIYSISDDIDVHVAFEVMNNRGKPLSTLELLKNRLIYLSTKFEVAEYEKISLRKQINDSWKSVYHYLGKNKEKPLEDDKFLLNHLLIYFSNDFTDQENSDSNISKIHRLFRNDFESFLLDKKFALRNIPSFNKDFLDTQEAQEINEISVDQISQYSESLQKSVELWYYIFNPHDNRDFNDDEKNWLDKIGRIGIRDSVPLIMTFYQKNNTKANKILFLKAIEKLSFIHSLIGYRYRNFIYGPPLFNFLQLAIEYKEGKCDVDNLIKRLEEDAVQLLSHEEFHANIKKEFRNRGFYNWDGIRYFLYEYELNLKSQSKSNRNKIDWKEFVTEKKDYITVEHIYPQNSKKKCWQTNFKNLTTSEKRSLKNSLGNLLPLSKPKNSSLSDKSFLDKKNNDDNTIGYTYGSFAENKVAKKNDWTPHDILERGIELMEFMEGRWNIKIGNQREKIEFLRLEFLTKHKK
jgi:uncharacterized protein with ParB-like and HNH nuclease domain